jgi:putative holliday junction resolvase
MAVPGRILGIDYGSRRVGLAVSDPLQIIAQGAGTIDGGSDLVDRLVAIVHEHEAVAVVVGMPYGSDGEMGAKAREIEAFIGVLKGRVDVPVDTWDESYTSVEAQRTFIAGGMKRSARRQKGRIDEMAARLLLQEYLESRKRQ